jgi:hypothetical protein
MPVQPDSLTQCTMPAAMIRDEVHFGGASPVYCAVSQRTPVPPRIDLAGPVRFLVVHRQSPRW